MKYVALLKELKSFLRSNELEESIAHIIIEDFLGRNYHVFLDDEVKTNHLERLENDIIHRSLFSIQLSVRIKNHSDDRTRNR